MAISNINYSNTFGHWLISTNQAINELNNIKSNNYTKSSGTLFLDSSAVGLSVSNNSLFSGNTTFTGGTAKNLSVYVPSYLYQTLNITANSSIVASGNVSISGIFTGDGSGLTTLNANNITSGTVSSARLGSGTANANTVLYGDNTWKSIISGASISNDVSTNNSYYPIWSTTISGTPTTVYTSNTKLYFNPSTGTLNATIFNSLSDENQKTEIKIITSAQDIVNQITGVEFVWKDNGKRSAGVIAQQLEKILPSLVDTNENSIKSVNYNGIIAYLIQSVKELDTRIKVLENK